MLNLLKKFINDKKFPSIARFGKGVAEHIYLSDEPSLLLIRGSGQAGDKAEEAFKAANKNLAGKVFMSVADYEDEQGKILAESLCIQESDLPTVPNTVYIELTLK